MGYHVEILRTQGDQLLPISKNELESLVSCTPNLRIEESMLGEADLLFLQGDREICRLTLQHGRLWTKNPEEEEMLAMLDIAPKLNARVRGDELETYRSLHEYYVHPDDEKALRKLKEESSRSIKISHRKTIIINAIIFGIFILIALIFTYFKK